MKKIVLFLFLIAGLSASAQNKEVLSEIDEVNFYGVDFSQVRVFGASESYEEFKSAFDGINNLFLSEPKKYDVAKFINKQVNGYYVGETADRIKLLDRKEYRTTDENYQVEEDALQGVIKELKIDEDEGVGLILVAELLNKAKNRGTYHIVYFDIQTREILDSWVASGKARGFGLRNFWAYSVLNVLKSAK